MFRGQGRGEAPPRWKPEGTLRRRMDISEDRWDSLSGPSVTLSESHLSSAAPRCISRMFYVVYMLKAGNWKPRRGFTDVVPAPCRTCPIVGRIGIPDVISRLNVQPRGHLYGNLSCSWYSWNCNLSRITSYLGFQPLRCRTRGYRVSGIVGGSSPRPSEPRRERSASASPCEQLGP